MAVSFAMTRVRGRSCVGALSLLYSLHPCMGGSPGDIGEVPVMEVKQWKDCRMSCVQMKRCKGWRMSCDIGLENEAPLQLILQPFCRFTYVTARSITLPFTSTTGTSPMSPDEPPCIHGLEPGCFKHRLDFWEEKEIKL